MADENAKRDKKYHAERELNSEGKASAAAAAAAGRRRGGCKVRCRDVAILATTPFVAWHTVHSGSLTQWHAACTENASLVLIVSCLRANPPKQNSKKKERKKTHLRRTQAGRVGGKGEGESATEKDGDVREHELRLHHTPPHNNWVKLQKCKSNWNGADNRLISTHKHTVY